MTKPKDNPFKTTKTRVGKQQLRKFKSEDEKLLSNLSRVKKTVKLSTQSITLNKDSLNVTSRRLTFPELVGKSRHTSENVKNHALIGLIEFIRRYEEEARLNLYTLLQVSCSTLFNDSARLRVSSRKLFLLILSTYFPQSCNSSSSEMIHLYLIQGILISNQSSNTSFYDDVYGLISIIIDKYPWVLNEYYEKLLKCLLNNTPESLSFKHFNCVYSLFKISVNVDQNTRNDLIEYAINVQYKLMSKSLVNDSSTINNNFSTKSTSNNNDKFGSKIDSSSNVDEIECLSNTSMTVKSFKLLLNNAAYIKHNDQRVVDLLLSVDLFEVENMTEKGKQTYERLFNDFTLAKIELSIKLLLFYSKHHVPLLLPLIQSECLKESIDSCNIAKILFIVYYSNVYHRLLYVSSTNNFGRRDSTLTVKAEWVNKILKTLSYSKLNRIQMFKNHLHQLGSNLNNYNNFNDDNISSIHNTNKFNEESHNELYNGYSHLNGTSYESDVEDGHETDLRSILITLYHEVVNSLFKSVLESPAVWPFICYVKGVSPVLLPEIFSKSHHWSYLSDDKFYADLITNHTSQVNIDDDSEFDEASLDFNFEQVMDDFTKNIKRDLIEPFLKMCLHISNHDKKSNIYYELTRITGLNEDHYTILAKIYLNLQPSSKLNEFLLEIVSDLYHKNYLLAFKEFFNVLLFQLFNIKSEARLDEQGRIMINYDIMSDIMERVDYFMKFYIDFIESENQDGVSNDAIEVSLEIEPKNVEDNKECDSTYDSMIKYMLKNFIDKYLMEVCKVDNNEDIDSTIRELVEKSLKPNYEQITTENKKKLYKLLKEVLEDYMDKDSMPEWITLELQ